MFLLPVTYSENSNLEVWLCAEPYIWDVEGKMLGRIVHYSLMSGSNMWATTGQSYLKVNQNSGVGFWLCICLCIVFDRMSVVYLVYETGLVLRQKHVACYVLPVQQIIKLNMKFWGMTVLSKESFRRLYT